MGCSDVHAEAATSLYFMVKEDVMPINMVDGDGAPEQLNYIEPGYRILSRGTITSHVESQYKEKKDKLKEELQSANKVALMTDCWTALTAASYIAGTFHHIDED